jgi:DNA polymerase III epsilon subunit
MPRLVTLAIATAATAALAVLAFLIWAVGRLTGREGADLWLPGAFGAFGLVVVFVLLWLFLEDQVFRPLIAMARRSEGDLRGEGESENSRHARTGLAPLSEDILSLGTQLTSERQTAVKRASEILARSDAQRHRLESILHDLSEGVIVCNLRHQVLLYNRVALWMLSGAGEVGLGRSILDLLEPSPIERTLRNLMEGEPTPGGEETASLSCQPLNEEISLAARMAMTFDRDGQADGYVLTLASENVRPDEEGPSARPEFYDFDLFHRPLSAEFSRDARLAELSYVVFDTETTGLRPAEGDRLISIAGVRIVNGRILRGETFNSYVNPDRSIPAGATRVHGITDSMVAEAPKAEEVLARFRRFVGGAVLVAHSAAFDMAVLQSESGASGFVLDSPVLDTLLLSLGVHDHLGDHRLDAIAERFGFTIEIADRHTALGDSLATAEIFLRLLNILGMRGVHSLGDALSLSEKQAKIRKQMQL